MNSPLLRAIAPAGTLIHIKGAGYRLVQDTPIEGATPFPVVDYEELLLFRELQWRQSCSRDPDNLKSLVNDISATSVPSEGTA